MVVAVLLPSKHDDEAGEESLDGGILVWMDAEESTSTRPRLTLTAGTGGGEW